MNIDIKTLLPIDWLQHKMSEVIRLVDAYGQVVLLQDNRPAYIITKAVAAEKCAINTVSKTPGYTLQEAMRMVLENTSAFTMHAAKLADTIHERGLYVQKNGEKVKYNQIRARCAHYPELFEALKGNFIRLRTDKAHLQEICNQTLL